MHTRTGMRTHNQAYVRRLDHVYTDPCPKKPKNTKTKQNFKQQF